ncbi:SpoIIE family protein phosphatase [Thioalkalivibrio sp. AKL17]|uniref:SpoIIE family protein phosphatase n=1 Tax=Thioalkalivibrio sp. AKL17 TaxID=1158160 RepID=UPI00037B21C0|nr:SpoIIE family protein phosphatase [Thioalkalivibrio sp. AKL17]
MSAVPPARQPYALLSEQAAARAGGQVLLQSRLKTVARRLGFGEIKRERMLLVCQELVTNQMKYARGTGLVQIWEQRSPEPALDLFAMDFGPGIADLNQALADGHTTSGTLGKGLGTVRRLADDSDFYSVPATQAAGTPWQGTAAWARFRPGDNGQDEPGPAFGRYLRALHDAPHNGDCADLAVDRHGLRWVHMDGLGHGVEAATAVAGRCRPGEPGDSPAEVLHRLSRDLSGSRGAVGIVGEVAAAQRSVRVCGVGDMNAWVVSEGERRGLEMAPGILGHDHRSCEELRLDLPPHALVITASDGIRRNWSLASFPGLWRRHPQLLALVLGQVLGRSNDDKSLLVIRL